MNLIAAECWVRPMAAGYLPHKLDSGIPPAAAAGTWEHLLVALRLAGGRLIALRLSAKLPKPGWHDSQLLQ
jgi:hypothetical protein